MGHWLQRSVEVWLPVATVCMEAVHSSDSSAVVMSNTVESHHPLVGSGPKIGVVLVAVTLQSLDQRKFVTVGENRNGRSSKVRSHNSCASETPRP
eukprot:813010-Rhodomonas_salina.1